MKKYFSILIVALLMGLGLASCSVETDEPAGGTTVEKMAGHWVVTVDAYDTEGKLLYEDPYNMGEWDMYTYNTANDDNDQIWLSDGAHFWDYTLKVPIDLNAQTFGIQNGFMYNDGEADQFCTITNGKIIKDGGLNVNGKPTDAIEYDITFTDDEYGFVYHVHGVRYAGF